MAFDASRGKMLMFGGNSSADAGAQLSDTWTWNGSNWQLVPAQIGDPGARSWHDMAFDSANNRIVMYGGRFGVGYLNDTWSWDGSWTKIATNDCGADPNFALAYDDVGLKVIYANNGETFSFVSNAWSRVAMSGFPAQYRTRLVTDVDRHRVVSFGGRSAGGTTRNDLFEFNGTVWNLVLATSPPTPRVGHGLAYDSFRKQVVLFGGDFGMNGFTNDTWEYGP
jgi:hypothetical protein